MAKGVATLNNFFLSIYPFFKCNYRCSYCYLTDEELSSDKKLEIKRLKEFIKNFNKGASNLVVEILGGEPLLFPKYIKRIVDLLRRECKNLKIKISTNGSIIDSKRVKLLREFDEVQLSLDACNKELYRRIRGGNFDRVIENIKILISEKIYPTLSFVIMKSNFNEIPHIFEFTQRLGVRKITFGTFIPYGRGINIAHEALSFKEISQASKEIEFLSRKYKIFVSNQLPIKIRKTNYVCPAGNYKLSILPSGDVVPCIFFRNKIIGKGRIDKILFIQNNYSICPAMSYLWRKT